MPKLIDISGQRFGFWVVEKQGENSHNGQTQWLCLCECGKKKLITSNSLRSGNSTSCGCNHAPDLIGRTFGELKVISLDLSKGKERRYWKCQCSCSRFITLTTNQLCSKEFIICKDHLLGAETLIKGEHQMKSLTNQLENLRLTMSTETVLRGATETENLLGQKIKPMKAAHDQAIINVIAAAQELITQSSE